MTITNPELAAKTLDQAVSNMVDLLCPDVKSEVTKNLIANSLTRFVIDACEKYNKGQKEHGGNLWERQLQQEIRNELIDTFFYTEALAWLKAGKNDIKITPHQK